MTTYNLEATSKKNAKRHSRLASIHRVTVVCLLLLSMGTLVDSRDTAIPDFRLTLNFLSGAFFQCQASDSENIRATAQFCLGLLVGNCGIESDEASIASGECDGSSAILRGINMVTTSVLPPSQEFVSQCVQDVFRSGTCRDFFERPYPYIDTISLGFDVPMPPMPSALPSLSPSLSPSSFPSSGPSLTPSPPEEILDVPEEPNVSDGSDTFTSGDSISTDASGLGRDPIFNPTPGSSDGNNIAVIAGSAVGVALLAGLLAMFAYKREKKQKAWREGAAMRDVTLDEDDDDIEAHDHVVDSLRTKEGLLYPPPPESSDTGSSLFGRMLASTATVALGALQFRSSNNDECTQEEGDSYETNLGSSQDDGSTENARDGRGPQGGNLASTRDDQGAQVVNDNIVPVSILKKPKVRVAAESPYTNDAAPPAVRIAAAAPYNEDTAPLPTVAPETEIALAPNPTNSKGNESIAISPVDSKAKSQPQQYAMGLLTSAMYPFHCLAPVRGFIGSDQLSEGSSIPYQTDFKPDESWDPDDNSMGSSEGEDHFQTTKPASPSERLLENVTKRSFEMQRLRTPADAESEPIRGLDYL
jgi:hypothetical protein